MSEDSEFWQVVEDKLSDLNIELIRKQVDVDYWEVWIRPTDIPDEEAWDQQKGPPIEVTFINSCENCDNQMKIVRNPDRFHNFVGDRYPIALVSLLYLGW